jgi:hypothetical protein
MAMIAGAHKLTFNSIELGVTERGFNCQIAPAQLPIRTDQFGRSIVDMLFGGIETGMVTAAVLEGSTTAAAALNYASLYPWLTAGALNTLPGTMYSTGSLLKSLVLYNLRTSATAYTFAKTVVVDAQRNFSSTVPVTWTIRFLTIIDPSNNTLFT